MFSKEGKLAAYTKVFFEKQKGKSLRLIILDLAVRFLSILMFPFIYFFLSIISLYKPIKIAFLYHERLGHLALNTDLYLRKRYLGLISKNEIHIFFVYSPANTQLVKMFARQITLINSEILSKIFSPFGLLRTRFWLPLPFIGNEYHEFNTAPPQISFSPEEINHGQNFLNQLGIDERQWYVCIFARDNRYYRTYSPYTNVELSDHRNADIDTYRIAAKEIINAGGWVIRMGSCVEKSMKVDHPKFIDYSSLDCRCDFLDVYITSKARFFVGTTSGASDLSVLFDIPFVGVNYMPIGYSPFAKNSIFISKRVYHNQSNVQVSHKEQLTAFVLHQVGAGRTPDDILRKLKWRIENNTEEEIKDIVLEMLDRLDLTFFFNEDYILAKEKYINLLPAGNIYRESPSSMGKEFLLSLNLN